MLLTSRMASIPCSSHHMIPYKKDIEHLFQNRSYNSRLTLIPQPTKSGLQYFNMRITQRLRRYRSMKKQWQEVATSVQNTSISPTNESPIPQDTMKNPPIQPHKSTGEMKAYCINDYINSTAPIKDYNEKTSVELDPLHSRIQQDLIKLRKFIKAKQKTHVENSTYKTSTDSSSGPAGEVASIGTTVEDQDNHKIKIVRKASSINKLKPLDHVKIAGCQMRPPILSKSDSGDSGVGSTSNPSSTCSQYPKQQKPTRQTNNNIFNIYHSRVNQPPPSHSSNSLFYRSSYSSKRKFNTPSKMSQNTPTRVSIPVSPKLEKKQPSFTKYETPLPPIRGLSQSDGMDTPVYRYNYAAPSSIATPRSMILKRNTSLLPILLQSSSCVGVQPKEVQSKKTESNSEDEEQEEEEENNSTDTADDYYHLLNYNHLINRLPKPIVSILPRHGQDDYGILFEQLDHIRETMPDSNTYDDYARIV